MTRFDKARVIQYAPLLALVALILFFSLATPSFFTAPNLVNLLNLIPVLLLAALGQTLVILFGGIDLSLEGLMAIASVMVGFLVLNPVTSVDLGLWVIPVVMLIGALGGLINGLAHTKLRIPSIMATLGLGFASSGLAVYLIKGNPIPILDPSIQRLVIGQTLGIPNIAWFGVAGVIIAWLVLKKTTLGRYIYAVGGNETIAAQLGIAVARVKMFAFMMAGAFYGIAGFLNTARLASGNAATSEGFLFSAITATVVGGTALTGGVGGVGSALIGAAIVTVLQNGMILMGLNPYVQDAVQGVVLITAVALTIDREKLGVIK